MADTNVKLDTRKLDALNKKVPGLANKIVGKMAFDTEAYIKTHFTTSPSSPGEAPGVVTGNLKNSVSSGQIRERQWRVFVQAEYGLDLEYGTSRMAARPFFHPAIDWLNDALPSYFKDIFK